MNRVLLTQEGYEKLLNELKHLKNNVRPEIIAAIAEARAHGDLKENAEYHTAKDRQSFTEGRIQELESVISNAEIFDPNEMNNDRVVIGKKIKLLKEETGEEIIYQLVGSHEADIDLKKISNESPIGRALIGSEVDDLVEVVMGGRVIEYTVLEIS
jgi:transcription elongation factor GreA